MDRLSSLVIRITSSEFIPCKLKDHKCGEKKILSPNSRLAAINYSGKWMGRKWDEEKKDGETNEEQQQQQEQKRERKTC